jgi:hypothetical protein
VRALPARALNGLFGLDAAAVTRTVFPGLETGAGPSFLA